MKMMGKENKESLIPVSGPSITQKEIDYVVDAVKNSWYENATMYHQLFEDRFAEFLNVKYAIALPSCTSAIHLALMALGVGEGDEVIVPDITWIATSAPISYVRATPVFSDIDDKSWCILPESIEKNISSKTKAIIAVDLYGNIPDMDEVNRVARQYSIPVIEDSAEALGSEYKNKKAGCLCDISTFSFHGSKIMTTGEGGMLTTDRKDIYDKCKLLRDHGRSSCDKMFWNTVVGYKYKMSGLQAALGLAQLERLGELLEKKRKIFSWYRNEMKNLNGVSLNFVPNNVKSNYWMITMICNKKLGITKEKIIKRLKEDSIDSRPFFYPLSQLPAYQALTKGKNYKKINKTAYSISPYAVNLPSGMNMTRQLVRRVCDSVKKIIKS